MVVIGLLVLEKLVAVQVIVLKVVLSRAEDWIARLVRDAKHLDQKPRRNHELGRVRVLHAARE